MGVGGWACTSSAFQLSLPSQIEELDVADVEEVDFVEACVDEEELDLDRSLKASCFDMVRGGMIEFPAVVMGAFRLDDEVDDENGSSAILCCCC